MTAIKKAPLERELHERDSQDKVSDITFKSFPFSSLYFRVSVYKKGQIIAALLIDKNDWLNPGIQPQIIEQLTVRYEEKVKGGGNGKN